MAKLPISTPTGMERKTMVEIPHLLAIGQPPCPSGVRGAPQSNASRTLAGEGLGVYVPKRGHQPPQQHQQPNGSYDQCRVEGFGYVFSKAPEYGGAERSSGRPMNRSRALSHG